MDSERSAPKESNLIDVSDQAVDIPGLEFGTMGDPAPGLHKGFEPMTQRWKSNAVTNWPWNVLTETLNVCV
jgi:hypothetical protein